MNELVIAPNNSALLMASPRYTPRAVSVRSLAIYGSIGLLWVGVLFGAWAFTGVFAWSAGILYVIYDTSLLIYVMRKTRSLYRERSAQQANAALVPAGPLPSVGILIAARNEASALPETLDALLAQTEPADCILVLDDGSSDDTEAVLTRRYEVPSVQAGNALRASTRWPALRVLSLAHGGKARALNAGIEIIETDLLVTVDADTILDPEALAALRRAFANDPKLVAAGGVLKPVCPPRRMGRFFQWFQTYEYVRAFISRIAWMRAGTLLLVSGALAGFRREALLRVGSFDVNCLVEDYELIHRLHRYAYEHGLAWHVGVLGEVRGRTDAPATLMSFLRQRRRWFAGFLQTQYWNRDMTGNGRYGALGRLMLPIKAVDTMQPIYGLTAFVLLLRFLISGHYTILIPVLIIILSKILIDLWFHLWSVRLYTHWIGERTTAARMSLAALAALAEPFSFQLMRHAGAAWGWLSFIAGRHRWEASAPAAPEGQPS
jgi:cellulose synthase/poly-beta-1,6-N-acetylglucosamine synthase-like glycosyltransferase